MERVVRNRAADLTTGVPPHAAHKHHVRIDRRDRDLLKLEDRGLLGIFGRRRRRAMITRLRDEPVGPAPVDVVRATRSRWAGDYRVRVPERTDMRIERDGLWVMAWLLAGEAFPGHDPVDPEAIADALAALPVLAREVFILHRRDNLDLRAIGERLGLSERAACEALASALMKLEQTLFPD